MIYEMTQPQYFHLLQIKASVSLEIKGFKTKGGSAYAYAKRIYNLKGSRPKILSWLEDMVELQLKLARWRGNYDRAVAADNHEQVDYAEGAIEQTLTEIQELQQ